MPIFLTDHPSDKQLQNLDPNVSLVSNISLVTWTLIFDGVKNTEGAGAGIIIISSKNDIQIKCKSTDNQAEYKALIIGLELLHEMGSFSVHIKGDSCLVIGQLLGV